MPRTISIGLQNFSEFRQNNYFYIDKTKFIKQWWLGGDCVTLITRPRRFGKTLMMDTVRTFFSPEFEGQGKLFEGLDVWQDEQFHDKQGKIPVIFLSFAEVKYDNYRETIEKIKEIITDLYIYFAPILDFSLFLDQEKSQFNEVSKTMSDVTAHSSLRNLVKYLGRQYGNKPIILLDEYDSPLQEAWIEGYWEKLVKFMRVLFNATFKTNPYLGRALITGITRVSKESIFSDLNNLECVGTTTNLYTDSFGFTEKEVFDAMDEFSLNNKNEVKLWYDGFVFGQQKEIYNPWSIIKFLSTGELDTYWKDTSSNNLVAELLTHGGQPIKKDTAKLLEGRSITATFDEQIVFSQLYNKEGAIWSLLMAAGYVKPVSFKRYPKVYELTLTNFETKIIFEDLISGWFDNVSEIKHEFLLAFLDDNLQVMNETLSEIVKDIFSYFDTKGSKNVRKDEPESFYHAFTLGLIVDLQDKYQITSNRESGYGRYDVMLAPKSNLNHGIVIEFKKFKNKTEKNLEETCNNALKQIYKNDYITKLKSQGLPLTNIYVYGFAFRGKEVQIGGGAYETIDWQQILRLSGI